MKKYRVITKVGNNPDGSARCVRYRCSDLISYCVFLDKNFPFWTWTNVYDKETGEQVGNFTKNNRPTLKHPY
jgi:hypothetical protein